MSSTVVLSPIVLFVYNRPKHTQLTIDALAKNDLAGESDLFVYSDAAKTNVAISEVNRVRSIIKNISGFKKVTIIERAKNWGLADSIIDGVTTIINKYGKVIVLEDDLVTSPLFLSFMNEGLDFYKDKQEVFSISGFSFSRTFMRLDNEESFDVYAHYRPMSWSWATWQSRWDKVDWDVVDYASFMADKAKQKEFELGGADLTRMLRYQFEGRVDSWYIRWSYSCFKQRLLNIYPRISLVNNTGHDGSGVHKSNEIEDIFSHSELLTDQKWRFVTEPVINQKLVSRFNESFNPTFATKVKRKFLNLRW